jgi:DNA-binding response OmpR family regulator
MTSPEDSRKLIYIVEDDVEQLTVLRLMLANEGYRVVTETDADRVVDAVRNLQPDLVLLDVMLPSRKGLDGFQLCTELRSDPSLKGTRFVIVSAIASGVGQREEKLRQQVGADDYFVKPYEPARLVQRVRELLRKA